MNGATVMSPAGLSSVSVPAPRVALIEHLLAVFPTRVSRDMTPEGMYRAQGRQEILDYMLRMASTDSTRLTIKEDLHRVPTKVQGPGPYPAPDASGPGRGEGAAIPRSARP